MPSLSSPEQRIIRSMLVEKFGPSAPLLDRVTSLEFATRQMTGTGYFVHFSNATALPRIETPNTELSGDYRTKRDAPCDVVGFTLFIRDGYLSSFEGYTFGDVRWPDELMEDWLVLDAA